MYLQSPSLKLRGPALILKPGSVSWDSVYGLDITLDFYSYNSILFLFSYLSISFETVSTAEIPSMPEVCFWKFALIWDLCWGMSSIETLQLWFPLDSGILVFNLQLHFGKFLCSVSQVLYINGGSAPLPVDCGILDTVALDTVFSLSD